MYLGYVKRAQNKRPNKNQMKRKGIQKIIIKISSSREEDVAGKATREEDVAGKATSQNE